MSLLHEARAIVRTNPMSLKIGHLKKCADAADRAYRELTFDFTRETAIEFIAHCSRLVMAIDMVQADQPNDPRGGKVERPKPSNLATAEAGRV